MTARTRSHRRSTLVAAALVVLATGVFAIGTMVNVVAAGADATVSGFYLALGASESVGVQPTISDPRARPTDHGYANDLVAYEAARGVTLQLTQLGCPGESTVTMMSGSDYCYKNQTSQLAAAMTFLQTHQSVPGIVTIDIGFNNVVHCFDARAVDLSCVATQIALVKSQLAVIIAQLKSVAGPGVSFVGLGHNDPFLAASLSGAAGQEFANDSAQVFQSLNAALQTTYANAGVPMAPVATAFQTRDHARVRLAGRRSVPDNVASTCKLTWMCQSAPYGPNLHPDKAGYAAIAAAIETVLRPPW